MKNVEAQSARSPSIIPPDVTSSQAAPALGFDFEAYKKYVEEFDLTEEQQCQLLAAIWVIVCNYVNFGFGVHPIQLVDENALVVDSPTMLPSPDTQTPINECEAKQTQFVGRED